jgi:regulator-associated protein of mTOR
MKTVGAALIMCLNIGVDPPDVVKTQPVRFSSYLFWKSDFLFQCARLECWQDPFDLPPQKALSTIGNRLQRQYERWQPKAKYKQCLDQTDEEVKRLCIGMRRSAKIERLLFHYNGHGVPRPTANGEVWVFNKVCQQF